MFVKNKTSIVLQCSARRNTKLSIAKFITTYLSCQGTTNNYPEPEVEGVKAAGASGLGNRPSVGITSFNIYYVCMGRISQCRYESVSRFW